MKNFGLFQFFLASGLAMLVTFPGEQIVLPVNILEDDKTTFEQFIEKFPESSLPYAIDMETLALEELDPDDVPEIDESLLLGDEFATILPALHHRQFSRMGPDDFFAEAILASTDDFHLLMYSRKHPFSFYSGSHVLAVFSRFGKLMDEMPVAYSYGKDGGMTCHIDESFTIEVSEKETVWVKDVSEYGYEDNKIEGYKVITSKFFTINKDGQFEEMDIKKEEAEQVVLDGNAD